MSPIQKRPVLGRLSELRPFDLLALVCMEQKSQNLEGELKGVGQKLHGGERKQQQSTAANEKIYNLLVMVVSFLDVLASFNVRHHWSCTQRTRSGIQRFR